VVYINELFVNGLHQIMFCNINKCAIFLFQKMCLKKQELSYLLIIYS